MRKIYIYFEGLAEYFSSLSLLALRLILAYGFYEPAVNKIGNIDSIASWFESMNIIFPTLSAHLATWFEVAGVGLLVLGFLTRFISIPLIVIMVVAISSVHISHGFSSANNGFEIPFYYIIMLFALFANGAGKISLDWLIFNKTKA